MFEWVMYMSLPCITSLFYFILFCTPTFTNLLHRNQHRNNHHSYRRNRPQMFFKTGVLKTFAILTGKHLCWILKACNFIKKRLKHRCFSVNTAKFLRTSFFHRTSLNKCLCSFDCLPFILLFHASLSLLKSALSINW